MMLKKEVFRILNKIDLNESRSPKMYPLDLLTHRTAIEKILSNKISNKKTLKCKPFRSSVFKKQ